MGSRQATNAATSPIPHYPVPQILWQGERSIAKASDLYVLGALTIPALNEMLIWRSA